MSENRPTLAAGSDEHDPDSTRPAARRASAVPFGTRAAVLAGVVMAAAGASDLLQTVEKVSNSTCCWPPIGS